MVVKMTEFDENNKLMGHFVPIHFLQSYSPLMNRPTMKYIKQYIYKTITIGLSGYHTVFPQGRSGKNSAGDLLLAVYSNSYEYTHQIASQIDSSI